ncbi:hypothetical protein AAMO2058_000439500 [Amorphochlora amoebiformis]
MAGLRLPFFRRHFEMITKGSRGYSSMISSPGIQVKIPRANAFVPPEGQRVNERDLICILEMLQRAGGKTVIISGAGVSTESGIPDYRSPEGSYSKGHKPMTHQDFVRKPHNRKRYWARSLVGWRYFDGVSPCYSHYALRELEQNQLISGIITQNVDRLHLRAGSENVVELHGNNDEVKCLSCGYTKLRRDYQLYLEEVNHSWAKKHFQPAESADIRADGDAHLNNQDFHGFNVPGCDVCHEGIMMPTVVFFGGSIPNEVKDRAMKMIEEANNVLVMGSSCQVFSVYRLCLAASRKESPIGLVNIGPTRVDPLVSVKLEARCGRTLKSICTSLGLRVE